MGPCGSGRTLVLVLVCIMNTTIKKKRENVVVRMVPCRLSSPWWCWRLSYQCSNGEWHSRSEPFCSGPLSSTNIGVCTPRRRGLVSQPKPDGYDCFCAFAEVSLRAFCSWITALETTQHSASVVSVSTSRIARYIVERVCVKPGFHYPSSRSELTARVDGPSTRVHFWHPSTRAVNSGVKKCTRVHGPSSRPVNSGRELG